MAKVSKGFGERMTGAGEVLPGTVDGVVKFARTSRFTVSADEAVKMAKEIGLSAADQEIVRKRVDASPPR